VRTHGVNPDPQISVIVPTRNEARNLPRLVQSLWSQSVVPLEVIVVDQCSTDDTPTIASELGCQVISRPTPAFYTPPAESRNIGASASSGNILLHLDADMELPDNEFLSRLVRLFDDMHRAAVIHEWDVADGFWSRVKGIERRCYWNSEIESARAVTRELFDLVGGYDVSISSGEDFDVSARYASYTLLGRADDVWLRHHTGHLSAAKLLSKKYSYGRSAKAYLDAGDEGGAFRAAGFATKCFRAYLTNWRYVLSDPLHYSMVFPIRAAEMVAILCGMLRTRIPRVN
jgi:glycosyltransferase involved in cell wall biosynthesis